MPANILTETYRECAESRFVLKAQPSHSYQSTSGSGGHEPWYRAVVRKFSAAEIFMLLFSVVLALVAVIFSNRAPRWGEVLFRLLFGVSLVLAVNILAWLKPTKWTRILRTFYVAGMIPIYFKTVELLSYPIRGKDYDDLLIVIDRVICAGVNPTVWLYQHFPTWPVLTEYLQICYSLFYILPIILGAELYRRAVKEEKPGFTPIAIKQLDELLFIMVFGFFLSFAAYFLLPSVGPRFTVHNFFSIGKELPGLAFTEFIRPMLNRGENILPTMSLTEARAVVTRDAFPSGHTDMTFLTIILAFRFRARSRWAILILGSSLIFSTVYLRYHYVIDVIGGVLLALLTLYIADWSKERMLRIRRRMLHAL